MAGLYERGVPVRVASRDPERALADLGFDVAEDATDGGVALVGEAGPGDEPRDIHDYARFHRDAWL